MVRWRTQSGAIAALLVFATSTWAQAASDAEAKPLAHTEAVHAEGTWATTDAARGGAAVAGQRGRGTQSEIEVATAARPTMQRCCRRLVARRGRALRGTHHAAAERPRSPRSSGNLLHRLHRDPENALCPPVSSVSRSPAQARAPAQPPALIVPNRVRQLLAPRSRWATLARLLFVFAPALAGRRRVRYFAH